jgi:hypothetical protein
MMKSFKQFYVEKQKGVDGKACWKGYKRMGTKKKGGKTVDNCVKTEENVRRMTGAPHASRISIDDGLKQQLLDHGMNMAQQGDGDLRTIVMTIGALVSRNDNYSDNAKRALHDYIGGEYVHELEAKLDAYDQEMFGEKNATCTKTTGKTSSTSKGKKYMKCVKSDSGGYKRIHWGQKGAKATGKSGNTKRKKSFRARHKCSTAKSNTPRGQACKDW